MPAQSVAAVDAWRPSRQGMLALASLLVLSGCTTVEGGLRPEHFQFVTVVPKTVEGPDGWRAACVHVGIRRRLTDELFLCKFGVEMPIENEDQGFISLQRAQGVAAKCANLAAKNILSLTTKETPIGIACEAFKTEYDLILNATIAGAHATKRCDARTQPVVVIPP